MNAIGRTLVEARRMEVTPSALPHISKSRSIRSEVLHMTRLNIRKFLSLSAVVAAPVLFLTLIATQIQIQAQILPPAPAAASVHITAGPEIESVKDGLAIIRWTSNNPGGSDEHFGVVHYGIDAAHLDQMAKSHIRLNQNHSYTVFRVRVDGLKPHTTYYYSIGSMQGNGGLDRVKSSVYHFTTP